MCFSKRLFCLLLCYICFFAGNSSLYLYLAAFLLLHQTTARTVGVRRLLRRRGGRMHSTLCEQILILRFHAVSCRA